MKISARAAAHGLPIETLEPWATTEAESRLEAFFTLRRAWAGTHNLSGPQALAEPWGADLVDGLAVAAISPVDRALVDVGAGSGVPGLIVACLQPGRAVILVEPIAKRTAFLRSTASRLGLTAVRVVRARWPVELPGVAPGAADVVSRAVVDPADWPTLAARGGSVVGAVIRMLAARRPACALEGFEASAALDYRLGAQGERRIERWVRIEDS